MNIMFNVELQGVPVSVGELLYHVESLEVTEVEVTEISVIVTKDNTFCSILVTYDTEIGETCSVIKPEDICIENRWEDVDVYVSRFGSYFTNKSIAEKARDYRVKEFSK